MFSSDMAIDLGTANTLVYVVGRGIVVNEPSLVAVDRKTRAVLGCGTEAKEMLGRTPANILAVRPLRDGVIADFELAEHMLNYFIRKASKRHKLIHPAHRYRHPERNHRSRKARRFRFHLPRQSQRSSLGRSSHGGCPRCGLACHRPGGNMVVDIGGGTTDIAVISLSGIVYSRSLRTAGNQMDEAISEHVKRKHNLLIGERMAEKIKMEIGTAYQDGTPADHGRQRPRHGLRFAEDHHIRG